MSVPSWSRLLLTMMVPLDRREDVLGDLEEVHRRRRERHGETLAWLQTSAETGVLAAAFVLYRLREREWNMGWMSGSEVRLALRLIKKQPIMALTVVLALAMGIGMATTGFNFLDAAVYGELPFDGGDRFARVEVRSVPDGRATSLDLARYQLFQDADSFQYFGAADGEDLNIVHASGRVDSLRGALITPATFRFLPYVPILGRSMTPDDGAPGAEPVVVLRESLWRRSFAARRNVIGDVIHVAGQRHTIVGVLDDDAGFPAGGELWVPLDDRYLGGSAAGPRRGLTFFGILGDDVTLATAQAEIEAIAERYRSPATASASALASASTLARQTRMILEPYVSMPVQATLQIGLMVVVLILLLVVIAANVANLVQARTATRTGELAVRTVLGAARSRLIGQLAIEVGLLAAIAAGLGLVASQAALRWLARTMSERPFWMTFEVSPRTVVFVVGVAVLASAVGGVLPAARATRRDAVSVLQSSGRQGGALGLGRLGAIMMVVELALSVALLSGAMVISRGLSGYLDRAPELPEGKILTARLLGAREAPGGGQAVDGPRSGISPLPAAAIVRALERIPGVEALGFGSDLPGTDAWPHWVEVDGDLPRRTARAAPVVWATPGFLETLDARVVAGRLFREADVVPGALPVAIVNEPFVRLFLDGGNPIGRRIRVVDSDDASQPAPWREIVGVVPDLGLSAADPERAAGLYLPWSGQGQQLFLALRTRGESALLDGPLRQAITGIDPNIRILRVGPLEEVNANERLFMTTFGRAISAMGLMALVLSLVCVYAMISFAVARRTREIGIRVAIGATRRQILRTLLGRVGMYLVVGGGIGAVLATAFIGLQDKMWDTRLPTSDPWVVPAVVLLLALAGVVACWAPARRALRILPAEALRFD